MRVRPRGADGTVARRIYPALGRLTFPALPAVDGADPALYEAAVVAYVAEHAAGLVQDPYNLATIVLGALTQDHVRRGDRWGPYGPLTFDQLRELRKAIHRRYRPNEAAHIDAWAARREALDALAAAEASKRRRRTSDQPAPF